MYLTITRPDLTFAVNRLSQFSSASRTAQMQAVYKVLHYVKGTVGQGLFYSATSDLQLKAFADSGLGFLSRHTALCNWLLFIGSSLVSWRSNKEHTVSRSSAEAEYRSLASAVSEMVWLTNFLQELGIQMSSSAPPFCDNTAARHLAILFSAY